MSKLRYTGNSPCRSNTYQFRLGRSTIERNCKVEAQLSGDRWCFLAPQQTYGVNRWIVNGGSRHVFSIDLLAVSLSRCRKRMHFSSSLSRGSGGMQCQVAGFSYVGKFPNLRTICRLVFRSRTKDIALAGFVSARSG